MKLTSASSSVWSAWMKRMVTSSANMVVLSCGPFGSPLERPNLAHFLRCATLRDVRWCSRANVRVTFSNSLLRTVDIFLVLELTICLPLVGVFVFPPLVADFDELVSLFDNFGRGDRGVIGKLTGRWRQIRHQSITASVVCPVCHYAHTHSLKDRGL